MYTLFCDCLIVTLLFVLCTQFHCYVCGCKEYKFLNKHVDVVKCESLNFVSIFAVQ